MNDCGIFVECSGIQYMYELVEHNVKSSSVREVLVKEVAVHAILQQQDRMFENGCVLYIF